MLPPGPLALTTVCGAGVRGAVRPAGRWYSADKGLLGFPKKNATRVAWDSALFSKPFLCMFYVRGPWPSWRTVPNTNTSQTRSKDTAGTAALRSRQKNSPCSPCSLSLGTRQEPCFPQRLLSPDFRWILGSKRDVRQTAPLTQKGRAMVCFGVGVPACWPHPGPPPWSPSPEGSRPVLPTDGAWRCPAREHSGSPHQRGRG